MTFPLYVRSQCSLIGARQDGSRDNSQVASAIRPFRARPLTWDLDVSIASQVGFPPLLSWVVMVSHKDTSHGPHSRVIQKWMSFIFFFNSHISVALITWSPFPHFNTILRDKNNSFVFFSLVCCFLFQKASFHLRNGEIFLSKLSRQKCSETKAWVTAPAPGRVTESRCQSVAVDDAVTFPSVCAASND